MNAFLDMARRWAQAARTAANCSRDLACMIGGWVCFCTLLAGAVMTTSTLAFAEAAVFATRGARRR
ncbi:hypothetical protein [Bradyrhizobium brasilense]|uniref:hypothetical protein n=1 Tax=Bradyrhizobium brasilense TaxID=1419277 RepID=UPI00115FAAC3|nr:hypothetical protein [Bradyrhizobium brasilense]